MPTKYEEEILEEEKKRDILTLSEIALIYSLIRNKAKSLANSVKEAAGDDRQYFTKRNRATIFAKKTNEELRPYYLKRDNLSKDIYTQEYRTSYFQANYYVQNEAILKGYNPKLSRYSKNQFKQALQDPLSKLMNSAKMQTGRSIDIQQLYTTIVNGVQSGQSLENITKQIDINLGYRDSNGKYIADINLRKGQTYRTKRILRTEIMRMRAKAQTDQWLNNKEKVNSDLVWLAVKDNRTRPQSAQMNNQKANGKGEFIFPNGIIAKQGESGVAAYEINDRCTTIQTEPEYLPKDQIVRNPKTGKNEIVPYGSFEQWASDNNLKKNVFGQVLFP